MHQTEEEIIIGYEVQRSRPTRSLFEANDAVNVKSFNFMENLKVFSSSSVIKSEFLSIRKKDLCCTLKISEIHFKTFDHSSLLGNA